MKSFLSLFAFLSLILLANTVAAARKDAGQFWRTVMTDSPTPEAIKDLVPIDAASSSSNEKADCHDHTPKNIEINEEKILVEDFELPRPNKYNSNEGQKKRKSFVKDFEPRPNVSAYGDDSEEKSFVKDFEPRPNVSAYGDDADLKGNKKSFVKDLEPRSNVSAYGNGADLKAKKKSFTSDFEPGPNVSVYQD